MYRQIFRCVFLIQLLCIVPCLLVHQTGYGLRLSGLFDTTGFIILALLIAEMLRLDFVFLVFRRAIYEVIPSFLEYLTTATAALLKQKHESKLCT